MSIESVEQRAKRVVQKVTTDQPTTAEDVQIIALYWAVSDQQEAAAAGTTTAADLKLLTVVRANARDGDAAAQTVCDAACKWRDRTRLGGPDGVGTFQWLLARAVDQHRQPRRLRNRRRLALGLGGVAAALFLAEGIADMAGAGPRLAHQVAVIGGAALFVASLAVSFFASRSVDR